MWYRKLISFLSNRKMFLLVLSLIFFAYFIHLLMVTNRECTKVCVSSGSIPYDVAKRLIERLGGEILTEKGEHNNRVCIFLLPLLPGSSYVGVLSPLLGKREMEIDFRDDNGRRIPAIQDGGKTRFRDLVLEQRSTARFIPSDKALQKMEKMSIVDFSPLILVMPIPRGYSSGKLRVKIVLPGGSKGQHGIRPKAVNRDGCSVLFDEVIAIPR